MKKPKKSFALRLISVIDGLEKRVAHRFKPAHHIDDVGFVFATTGPLYNILARRAARNLRQVMPTAQIDLYTDEDLSDPVFSQIHLLAHSYFRPKMEALRRSRFKKTVYLDADIVVLSDVSELFAVLDKVEIAACQGWARQTIFMGDGTIPRAFPMMNSGMLAVKRSRRSHRFLKEWENRVRGTSANVDQESLRRTLYDSNMPFIILPLEYNMIFTKLFDVWENRMGAPRILHFPMLHERDPGNPEMPFDAMTLLAPKQARRLAELVSSDRTLRHRPTPARAPATSTGGSRWKLALRRMMGYWGKVS